MDFGYFQTQLGPYGEWVEIPDNGSCWVPTVVKVNPDWRPYVDNGKWDYTDQGWFWTSEYPWGEIVFHYGRWVAHPQYHWVWKPGFDWAPAWVAWRDDQPDGAVAWAPLPPEAQFQAGVGLEYNGQVADAANVDFGLAPAAFVFVGFDHFWDLSPQPLVIAPEQISLFYSRSVVRNNYSVVGGRLRVEGPGRNRMENLTGRRIMMKSASGLYAKEEHDHVMVRRREHPEVVMRPPIRRPHGGGGGGPRLPPPRREKGPRQPGAQPVVPRKPAVKQPTNQPAKSSSKEKPKNKN